MSPWKIIRREYKHGGGPGSRGVEWKRVEREGGGGEKEREREMERDSSDGVHGSEND